MWSSDVLLPAPPVTTARALQTLEALVKPAGSAAEVQGKQQQQKKKKREEREERKTPITLSNAHTHRVWGFTTAAPGQGRRRRRQQLLIKSVWLDGCSRAEELQV